MVLIVFLLAYIVRRRLDTHNSLSGDKLWRHWFHQAVKVEAGHESGIAGGLALVVLPALILGLGMYLLDAVGWRVVGYPIEWLILILMMGAPGWRPILQSYSVSWQRGDMQAAWLIVEDRLPPEERGAASSPDVMHLTLSKAFLVGVFQRFFLVGFWYVVGGIGLAVLARGLVALSEQWPQAAARTRFQRLAEWMAWLPVRLLSVTFGIAGDLAGWLREFPASVGGVSKKTADVLMISANGSLTGYALDPERFSRIHPDEWVDFGGRSLGAILDLLNRSMLVWICGLALLVIFGVL
ncbi:regulatory signaling modulator protein AmpE [Marinobacter sp. M216]|uniref:Regulatory signaling modulator protein AmpE n=1 Tax=Marinobacter albus TaxID=3030833 RepID=A0ABT7HJM4_9GAMM|nr:regulatory signaling modulator protein AmpE [Marinobacter sp. M216]MDK9559731.1 regulatory signaling modulator protein AmpE [Marinobacter sp. M216]